MTTIKQTAKQFIAEQRRHEINGEWEGDSLADMACECFNVATADVDDKGDVWIDGAATGCWLDGEAMARFAKFVAERCKLSVETTDGEQGRYQSERLDAIRAEIAKIESGTNPQICPLSGQDLLAYWKEQEAIGEAYLANS